MQNRLKIRIIGIVAKKLFHSQTLEVILRLVNVCEFDYQECLQSFF
jgi:hypothetical protein